MNKEIKNKLVCVVNLMFIFSIFALVNFLLVLYADDCFLMGLIICLVIIVILSVFLMVIVGQMFSEHARDEMLSKMEQNKKQYDTAVEQLNRKIEIIENWKEMNNKPKSKKKGGR
mgnify:FL=1